MEVGVPHTVFITDVLITGGFAVGDDFLDKAGLHHFVQMSVNRCDADGRLTGAEICTDISGGYVGFIIFPQKGENQFLLTCFIGGLFVHK